MKLERFEIVIIWAGVLWAVLVLITFKRLYFSGYAHPDLAAAFVVLLAGWIPCALVWLTWRQWNR